MQIRYPRYYDSFRCLAGDCPDTCCRDWDIQVDERTQAFYNSVPGELGEKLRAALRTVDGEVCLVMESGRCPLQCADGLCSSQAALGEEGLCEVCRTFPRLRHEYGTFTELGLELSCPEAARLILCSGRDEWKTREEPGGEEPEYDTDAMEILLQSREKAGDLLFDSRYSVGEELALLLFYGYHVQAALDGCAEETFDPEAALKTGRELAAGGDRKAMLAFCKNLEILTEEWKNLLNREPVPGALTDEYRALAWYFVSRYWLQAVSDYDLLSRVKFAIISCLIVCSLGGDLAHTAMLYSREIENDAENVDAFLDAAYGNRAFTDAGILNLLL